MTIINTGTGEDQKDKSSKIGHKMIDQLYGNNQNLIIEKWIEIAKVLEYKTT